MKIFGVSLVTILLIVLAYYAGSKGMLKTLTGGRL